MNFLFFCCVKRDKSLEKKQKDKSVYNILKEKKAKTLDKNEGIKSEITIETENNSQINENILKTEILLCPYLNQKERDYYNYLKKEKITEEEWTNIINKDELKLWMKPNSIFNDKCNFVKIYSKIPLKLKCAKIFEFLYNPKIRQRWDKQITEYVIIERNNDENSEIYYTKNKVPIPLASDRDFVEKRIILKIDEKEEVALYYSVLHDQFPQIKGTVRGYTHLGAIFVTECDNAIEFWSFNQVDSGFKSLDSMKNLIAKKYETWLNLFKEELEKKE